MQDDEILDHYDDMMQPYFDSREYACSQNIIDLLTEKLRHTLTPEQNTDLTRLLMAHIEIIQEQQWRPSLLGFGTVGRS